MSTTNNTGNEIGKKFLRPALGLLVRKPDGTLLDDAGEWIVLTHYWYRRMRVNDVVVTDPPTAIEKAVNTKPASKKGKPA